MSLLAGKASKRMECPSFVSKFYLILASSNFLTLLLSRLNFGQESLVSIHHKKGNYLSLVSLPIHVTLREVKIVSNKAVVLSNHSNDITEVWAIVVFPAHQYFPSLCLYNVWKVITFQFSPWPSWES